MSIRLGAAAFATIQRREADVEARIVAVTPRLTREEPLYAEAITQLAQASALMDAAQLQGDDEGGLFTFEQDPRLYLEQAETLIAQVEELYPGEAGEPAGPAIAWRPSWGRVALALGTVGIVSWLVFGKKR